MDSNVGTGREVVVDVREQLLMGKEPFSDIMKAAESCAVGDTLVLYATFKPVPLLMLLKGHGFEGKATKLGKRDWRVDFHRVRGPKGQGKAGAETARPPLPEGVVAGMSNSDGGPDVAVAGLHTDGDGTDGAAGIQGDGASTAGAAGVHGDGARADGVAGAQTDGTQADAPVAPDESIVHLNNRGLEPPQPMVRTLEAVYALQPGQRIVGKFDRPPMFLLPKLEEMGYTYEVTHEEDGRAIVTIWHKEVSGRA